MGKSPFPVTNYHVVIIDATFKQKISCHWTSCVLQRLQHSIFAAMYKNVSFRKMSRSNASWIIRSVNRTLFYCKKKKLIERLRKYMCPCLGTSVQTSPLLGNKLYAQSVKITQQVLLILLLQCNGQKHDSITSIFFFNVD